MFKNMVAKSMLNDIKKGIRQTKCQALSFDFCKKIIYTHPESPEPKFLSSDVRIQVPEHGSCHRGAGVPCRSHKWGEDATRNRHIPHK